MTAARGRYGAFETALDGDVQLGKETAMRFFLRARGPADAVPYAQNIAAGQTLDARAIVAGIAEGGFHVGGTVTASGPSGSGEGFLAVDEHGVGEFGPFAFARNDGSWLVGSLRLDRPISASAGWISARRYPLTKVVHAAALPGIQLAGFPAIGGTLDADLVGGGPPSAFGLAGRIHLTGLTYDRYPLGTAYARIGGTFDDVRLRDIALDGPIGRFRGAGAFSGDTLALDGRYDGSLGRLETFSGPIGGRGAIGAPVALIADGTGLVVQTRRGSARRSVHGSRSARFGDAGDPAATRCESSRPMPGCPAGASSRPARRPATSRSRRSTCRCGPWAKSGILLERGRLWIFGIADFSGPGFQGTIDVANGLARGYPVHGWADLAFAGSTVAIAEGVGAIGSTYGRIGGRVENLGTATPRYRLAAAVPLNDDAALIRDL